MPNEYKNGHMKVFSLYEGSYSVDNSKHFIPFDPQKDDKKDRPGSLFIHVHPFLIKTTDQLILLDTGLGYRQNGELVLHQNIRNAGFNPNDVTMVLMSHLHQDHASGMVVEKDGKVELSFPNAEYIIQRGEWENGYSGVSDSYKTPVFDVLQRSGNLHLVEGNGTLNETVHYELSGGHTEFHQVFHIVDEEEHYFFGGDEWPEPQQILRKFAAKYDYDGRKAMELRDTYAKEAAEKNWICLFYHAARNAIATIQVKGDSFQITGV